MGIEFGRNLAMLLSVKKGHIERLFFLMAFRSVVLVGLPMLLCKKFMVLLIVPVEEHRSLGGNIISKLYHCAFVGLIYELLVFS